MRGVYFSTINLHLSVTTAHECVLIRHTRGDEANMNFARAKHFAWALKNPQCESSAAVLKTLWLPTTAESEGCQGQHLQGLKRGVE